MKKIGDRAGCIKQVHRLRHALFFRGQFAPRTSQSHLYSERCGEKQVDLACFYFLEVSRRNFSFFGKFILRQISADTFAPDICAERFNSRPFFSGQSHDILHRVLKTIMNDIYIVKNIPKF